MSEIVCCGCAVVNRLPPDKPYRSAGCGRCGTALFAGNPCDVSVNGGTQVKRSGIPVLLDAKRRGACLAGQWRRPMSLLPAHWSRRSA